MKKIDHTYRIADARAPNDVLYFLLQGCTERKEAAAGRQCYDHLVRSKLETLSFWGDQLIRLFASCGNLFEANQVFYKVLKPSIYTWNAIISAQVQLGDTCSALQLYHKMQLDDVRPDRVTFLWVLKACSCLADAFQGRITHIQIIENGLGTDQVVGNTLVDMFAKCGSLGEAHHVFDRLLIRDEVSWGAIIAGYVQHGLGYLALKLFEHMQQDGIRPDRVIFLCISKAIASIGVVTQGRPMHDEIIKNGLELDVALGSSLIDMYAKCGSMEEAKKLFERLPKRNVVSWGALVGGFSNQGHDLIVFDLYEQMQQEGVLADRVIFLCVLKSCGSLGALQQGRLIDGLLRKRGLDIDVLLGSTLVEMYVKCGNLEDAYKVLTDLPSKNHVSWGAIIAGYSISGDDRMMMQCLYDMRQQGMTPDQMIFTQILTSCSHAGLLEEGCRCFTAIMAEHGMTPSVEQYTCMVDLLGRAGCLDVAQNLVETMPIPPDNIVWRSLLTGCKIYSNVELGRRCFDRLRTLDSNDAAAHTLMSDIFEAAHMWEDADKIQELRVCASTSKKLGRAWIEVTNEVHEFIVGDKLALRNDEISSKYKGLTRKTKQQGYLPQVDIVLDLIPDDVDAL